MNIHRRTIMVNGVANMSTRYMLEKGYNVALFAHSQEQADAMSSTIPQEYRDNFRAFFVGREDREASITRCLEDIKAAFGGLDVVATGAGQNDLRNFEDLSEKEFTQLLPNHIFGAYSIMKHTLPLLKESGSGRFINFTYIESMSGRFHNGVAGAAGKAGIIALTRNYALAYAKYGITANCIAIGAMKTLLQLEPDYQKAIESRIPVGHIATADDIAPILHFLASEESRYITGAVINASGGAYMD